jgi:hypothetical protein
MKKKEVSLLNKKFPSIELLNSEGPILKTFKTQDGYMMIDEHQELIAILNDKNIYNYVSGKLSLIDSEGRDLKYSDYSSGMKPELSKLCEFLGIDGLIF